MIPGSLSLPYLDPPSLSQQKRVTERSACQPMTFIHGWLNNIFLWWAQRTYINTGWESQKYFHQWNVVLKNNLSILIYCQQQRYPWFTNGTPLSTRVDHGPLFDMGLVSTLSPHVVCAFVDVPFLWLRLPTSLDLRRRSDKRLIRGSGRDNQFQRCRCWSADLTKIELTKLGRSI